jgi:two-component sensor histidine kinase
MARMTRTARGRTAAPAPPPDGVVTEGAPPAAAGADDPRVRWLEAELRVTRVRLQTTIEAMGEQRRRVRNILGLVRSIVGRTVRSAGSVEEFAGALDGRLAALARTQLAFSRGVDAVELEDIIRDEMVAGAVREAQFTLDGPAVRLRSEAAESLALALHELTTNAIRYGALSEPDGSLSVLWRVKKAEAGRRLSLEWRESGVRAVAMNPARNGFGRELIERGLPCDLGADTSLEFAPGGVRACIALPLTDQMSEPEPVDPPEDRADEG